MYHIARHEYQHHPLKLQCLFKFNSYLFMSTISTRSSFLLFLSLDFYFSFFFKSSHIFRTFYNEFRNVRSFVKVLDFYNSATHVIKNNSLTSQRFFFKVFNQHVFVYINSLFSLSLSTKQHKNYFAYVSKIFEFWVVQKNTQKLV